MEAMSACPLSARGMRRAGSLQGWWEWGVDGGGRAVESRSQADW